METERDRYVYPGRRFTKCGTVSGEGQGMSLRDWFAGQALLSLVGDPSLRNWAEDQNKPLDQTVARAAYKIADAMLAERANLTEAE